MLIYHPTFDVNHCLFRILAILESCNESTISLELLKIIDFYVLFPSLIKKIKPFPRELTVYRKHVFSISSEYERVGNLKRIMFQLEAIQSIALNNLAAKGFVDLESYNNKVVCRTALELPRTLKEKIKNSSLVKEEWFLMLVGDFTKIEMNGPRGLKLRTGLMEYRYDVVRSKNE